MVAINTIGGSDKIKIQEVIDYHEVYSPPIDPKLLTRLVIFADNYEREKSQ